MKTQTIRRTSALPRSTPRYPNAADRRYYLHKLVDGLLALATGVGAFVTIVFLLLL